MSAVSEDDRLQNANSFRDTAEVLRMTRAGVAWMAVGCARGAYENALAYAISREQFGRPIAGFQLVQDLLVRMLGNITSSWALCARLSQLQDEGGRGGQAFIAGQGMVHGQDARNRRVRARILGWQRDSVGAQRRTFRRRRRGDLLLRRHPGNEHAHRRTRHHRVERLR